MQIRLKEIGGTEEENKDQNEQIIIDTQLLTKIKKNISEILPPTKNSDRQGGLYLTGFSCYLDFNHIAQALKELNITSVLTITKGHNINFVDYNEKNPENQINHKIFPLDDDPDEDILQFFNESIQFLEKELQTKNVVVHCVAGVSRSASLVISYLMKTKNIGYERARAIAQQKRPQVNPNPGFIRQLRKFQKNELKNLSDSDNYKIKLKE